MKNFRTLMKYLDRYKMRFVVGFIFIILTHATALFVPRVLKYAVNALVENLDRMLLLQYGVAIVGITVLQGALRFIMRMKIMGAARLIEYDMRNDLFLHIQKLSLSYFNRTYTGDIMARFTNDLRIVGRFAGNGIMGAFDTVTLVILTIVYMILINPATVSTNLRLMGYAFLPLPIATMIVYKFHEYLHARYDRVQEHFSEMSARAQENLAGIRVVKAYVQEKNEIEEFSRLGKEYILKNMDLAKISSFFFPILMFISGLSVVIVLWLGGREVIVGRITLGDFVAFGTYLTMLTWPMMSLGHIIGLYERTSACMGRINEILYVRPEITDREADPRVNSIRGDIEFRGVSFSYGTKNQKVLENIDLKIRRGMTLAVVGRTGSGKSTLINLIPRLYEIRDGQLLIDGIDIKKIPLKVLRENVGFIPQETFLFSDTIRENIAYGVNDARDEDINEAATISQVVGDLQDFPEGFDTMVGERGITLSGGQKQRVAIARAVIRKPSILILDDALSSVDTNTEEEILKRLRGVMRERTSIIIAHRISTVRDADWIIVLDRGRIVEQGRHDDLVALDGIYAGIYRKQLLDREIEEENGAEVPTKLNGGEAI
ncbi:MAG: ABC transporter ATP-binding protein [bacterium]